MVCTYWFTVMDVDDRVSYVFLHPECVGQDKFTEDVREAFAMAVEKVIRRMEEMGEVDYLGWYDISEYFIAYMEERGYLFPEPSGEEALSFQSLVVMRCTGEETRKTLGEEVCRMLDDWSRKVVENLRGGGGI